MTLKDSGTLVQVDLEGKGTFILPKLLGQGSSATFACMNQEVTAAAPGVEVVGALGDALKVSAKTANTGSGYKMLPVLTYQMQPGPVPEGTPPIFAHGAHLHPVYSPSGRLVTGNHPPDHPHQRGIWFAWTHTEFEGRTPDFWNMGKEKYGGVTGEVRFDKLNESWSGPVHGGFVSTHRWIDHTSGAEKDMLSEKWEVSVIPTRDAFVLDFVSTQTCTTNEPVKLPKYHYGGLGIRGNALWDPVEAVSMLTSNGDDRIKGDGSKAKWVWLGGEVEGQTTGITVLIHPQNFRFPQPLRLNPKNPQLCVAPSAEGDWAIEPGQPYVSRYRLLIRDGRPDVALLERLWADYAEPVEVTAAP